MHALIVQRIATFVTSIKWKYCFYANIALKSNMALLQSHKDS